MKGIQLTLLLIFSMGFFSPLMAQGPDGADMGNILDFLEARVDLSEEQVAEIEGIIADYEADKAALAEQEFDNVLEKMKAFWDLKVAFWEQIKSVLTEEQLADLGMRGGDRGDHDDDDGDHDDGGHGDHDWGNNPCHPDSLDLEGLGAAIQAYKAENIEPAILELRAGLDESISAEDQARIAELRTSFADFKAELAALKEEAQQEDADRQAIWERMKELKETMQADREALKELLERYREDIKAAFESISEEREQWAADMQAIKVEYLGEECANRRHGRRGHEGRRGERNHRGGHGHHRGGKKAARFLLLDPAGEGLADNPVELPNHTLSVSPNPAVSYTTITYKVVEDARITIFLQDGKGNLLRQVVDGQKQAGTYTVEVDLSRYKTGSYYFTLSDGVQLISEAAIITK